MKFVLLVLAFTISMGLFSQNQCRRAQWDFKSNSSDSINVLHYDINLDIVYLSQRSIDGYTQLKLQTLFSGMSTITLDLQNLITDSVFIGQNKITNWTYNDTNLRIPLISSPSLTDTLDCIVYYHGQPQKDPSGWGGFYFSNDSTFAFNMAVGMQDNPHNYGRIWYPCVDNFTDRATYDFNITVKNNNVAICNGTLVSTTNSNNTKEYHWNLQNDIPTYLASVAIGEYVAVEDTFNSINGPIPIAIYVPQNKVAAAQGSFVNLKQILAAYEHYYGPYKWERIGYVGIPFNSGAMEHATTIHIGLGYINGATTYESLIAHELSHHWFGDLVTCHSAPDMWLNEGWAVFSESMYKEYVYGRKAYKDNMRDKLNDVLKNTHNADNGYRAVAGVPHEYTYGSTVYDKGATVAHSLRGYLGDSLFFNMLKAYLLQNSYTDQTSYQFRDFITNNTGINMNDFFDAWVFSPGFPHFDLGSVDVNNIGNGFSVNVTVQQSLLHKPNYANSNRTPITMMDDSWNRKDTIVEFSGQNGSNTFYCDFEPTMVYLDLEETFGDATIDYSAVLNQAITYDFPMSYFKMEVKSITDSSLFQITHNLVKPDTMGIVYQGLKISNKRYWSVRFNNKNNVNIEGKFKYQKGFTLDGDLIHSSHDSLVLLYREYSGIPWKRVSFDKQGSWVAGYMVVENLKSGQYVLGSYAAEFLGIDSKNAISELKLIISPNPSSEDFNFVGNFNFPTTIGIYDSIGKQVDMFEMDIENNKSTYRWQPNNIAKGTYIVVVFDKDGTAIYKSKLVVVE